MFDSLTVDSFFRGRYLVEDEKGEELLNIYLILYIIYIYIIYNIITKSFYGGGYLL